MEKPKYKDADILLETPYVNVYDLQYEDGTHYYDASRRKKEALFASKEHPGMPDAVSGFVILKFPDRPRLLMFQEYRYPTGQYVLSIPSGLIDQKDIETDQPLIHALERELREETGIIIRDKDVMKVIQPLVFCSPGFTDESTALIAVVVNLQDDHELNQNGAEGTERFDGFILTDMEETKKILAEGCDEHGVPYPLVTWAAMMYFVSRQWEVLGKGE